MGEIFRIEWRQPFRIPTRFKTDLSFLVFGNFCKIKINAIFKGNNNDITTKKKQRAVQQPRFLTRFDKLSCKFFALKNNK